MKVLSSLRTKLLEFMYSSEDLEKFYFQYQTEALPHGESLQSFCVKNKVPYNIFQKWYKDTHKKVVEVQIDGLLEADSEESTKSCPQSQAVSERRTVTLPICVVNTAVCCLSFVNGFTGNPMMGMFLINNSVGMAENQKDRYIQYLAEQNQDLWLTSDAGAEMAATYHSVIGTVKLHGSSVWNFIGTFLKNIFNSLWVHVNVKFKTN